MRFVAKSFGKGKLVEQLFDNLQVDSSKARNLLDWNPPETLAQAMNKLRK